MPNATDRPSWDEFKAQLDAAIQDVVDAQNELNDAQTKLTRAQERLRDLSDRPPGSVPDVSGP
jgi:flagellar hook-basal body complex protein FliE